MYCKLICEKISGREFGQGGNKKVLKRRGRRVQVQPDFIKQVESRIGQAQVSI